MGLFVCLFCVIIFQTQGRVAQYSGENAVNVEQKLPYSYTNGRGLTTNGQPARGAKNPTPIPTANQIVRNEVITGHIQANSPTNSNRGDANIANTNLINPSNANANRASTIIEHINPTPSNQASKNVANENLATSNFADVKLAAQNLANNIASNNLVRTNFQGIYPNLGYGPNSNLINNNIKPELANQLYRPNVANSIATNLAGPLYNNINTYNAPNTFKPFNNNFNLANPNFGLGSYFPNFGNGNMASGNIANGNFAQALAPTGSLTNTIMPGSSFAIGGNPFTVLSGMSGNQEIGLSIVADALEVGGSVSVVGKMPFYGTVALSGSLPADGTATVNYGCTSQSDL